MIIDLPDFESQNVLAELPAGRYMVIESLYALERLPSCQVILSEIVTASESRTVGADLQILFSDGSSLFRDFAMAPDGGWRDSYGAKADTLADLLPPEVASFKLINRLGTLVEHDGHGRLIAVRDEEANHGA